MVRAHRPIFSGLVLIAGYRNLAKKGPRPRGDFGNECGYEEQTMDRPMAGKRIAGSEEVALAQAFEFETLRNMLERRGQLMRGEVVRGDRVAQEKAMRPCQTRRTKGSKS